MATEVQHHSEESVTSLASGIVNDFQDLLKQQLQLTRQELKAEFRQSKEAAAFLSLGGVIVLIGLFAICLMLAHLLHWLGAPTGSDPSALPLWASFAVVGSLFLLGGGFAIFAGKKKIDEIGTPLHETTQGLKENLEWKTNTNVS
jgi:hypothetical protein